MLKKIFGIIFLGNILCYLRTLDDLPTILDLLVSHGAILDFSSVEHFISLALAESSSRKKISALLTIVTCLVSLWRDDLAQPVINSVASLKLYYQDTTNIRYLLKVYCVCT